MTQLLASYYVEATNYLNDPVGLPAGDVRIERSPDNGNTWVPDSLSRPANNSSTPATNFWTEIIQRSYQSSGQTRYYYKIDVYRGATTRDSTTYRLIEPGIYERRLAVEHEGTSGNTITLTRKVYLTIQPDIEVYRTVNDQAVPLITTAKATPSTNPLKILKTITVENTSDALAARKVLMNNANKHKASVSIKTNVRCDAYCNDFSHETSPTFASIATYTWLLLLGKIRMKRSGTQWSGSTTNPVIQSDYQGDKYVNAVPSNNETHTLDFEKPILILPLHVSSNLELRFAVGKKFTDNGNGADENYPAVALPLSVILKTTHACIVTPSVITLDEDNNYTSFVAVEANDGINWTLPNVDPRLTVSATSGTERMGVVVRKNTAFSLNDTDFHNITLTAQSVVDSLVYPDIDGNYTESDTVNVHVEAYKHTRNALIPKQSQEGSFDHTLTNDSRINGTIGTFDVNNIDTFPSIGHKFANGELHRIRSWSMQSIGAGTGRRATRLILSGKTLDGEWIILDDTAATITSTTSKTRADRIVKNTKLVNEIRVTAIAASSVIGSSTIGFPQIQVFAGEWVVPGITTTNLQGVTITPNDAHYNNRIWVFDRNVSGNNIAHVGSAHWYFGTGAGAIDNHVALNGEILGFPTQSLGWLAISFTSHNLIGYLYSIDALSGTHANSPYAASLYFEGRETANTGAWEEIGIISLDKCIGKSNVNIIQDTDAQKTLNEWAENVLGLTGSDRNEAFIVEDDGAVRTVIQYNGTQWQVEANYPEVIDKVSNQTHYADFANTKTFGQLRFTAKSIMNTSLLAHPGSYNVAMPDIQFFGMPTRKINTGNNVATVAYLKAEDSNGDLHDILGRNQTLRCRQSSSPAFRFYVSAPHYIATSGTHARRIYLSIQNTSGEMPTTIYGTFNTSLAPLEWSPTATAANPTYYEIYIYSSDNEKIILSSGYTGGLS